MGSIITSVGVREQHKRRKLAASRRVGKEGCIHFVLSDLDSGYNVTSCFKLLF